MVAAPRLVVLFFFNMFEGLVVVLRRVSVRGTERWPHEPFVVLAATAGSPAQRGPHNLCRPRVAPAGSFYMLTTP